MSEYVFYPGCVVPTRLPFIESAARFIFEKLGVKVDDFEGFTCCMEPIGLRSMGPDTWLNICARLHSIAAGRKILTICDGCNMSLTDSKKLIDIDVGKEKVGPIMHELGYDVRTSETVGMLEFLHSNLNKIRSNLQTEMDFKLAIFPGCHCEAACASKGLSAENMMADIVKVLGGKALILPKNLCCGGGLSGVVPEMENNVMKETINTFRKAGAIAVVTSCPFCFMQFDMVGRHTTLHLAEIVASGMGWQEDAKKYHKTK